jgi:predicted RNA-binding protein
MPFKVRNESIRPSIKELLISLLKKKPYERPIIAVIRSTVEGILEEMEAELSVTAMLTQLHQKSTSIEHINHIPPDISTLKNESKINKNNSEVNINTPSK